jgi:hypothetical protein
MIFITFILIYAFNCKIAYFRMLIVELYTELYGTDGACVPQHIKTWSRPKKMEWLMTHLQPLVNKLFVPYRAPNMENVKLCLKIGNENRQLSLPPTFRGQVYEVLINGTIVKIPIPGEATLFETNTDEHNKYTLGFMRVMMDFCMLDDIIHAADIDRLPVCLKRLLPSIVGLTSFRSNYSIEIIIFLTKTEHVLSPRDSVAVKLRAFVNPHGREGCNKAADMQQENNIKLVKQVLKGLGASKTDKSMVRASLAAPGISLIVDNFRTSVGLQKSSVPYKHHKKPD